MIKTALTVLIAFLLAVAADVTGKWKVEGTIGNFPVNLVCTFKEDNGKLTGVCKGEDVGELKITGETDSKTVKWNYDVNFQGQQFTVFYEAQLESANEMKGTITVMGNPSGSFTAKKQ
jgi:hypothetical protein